MKPYSILSQTVCQRVSDAELSPILNRDNDTPYQLVMVWPQLGDFDSLEYAWWLQRNQAQLQGIALRAIGIGNRLAGKRFCKYTGFSEDCLFVEPDAGLHHQLGLYAGLSFKIPGFSPSQNAWLNLMLMCAGIGSPGTLSEVFRGYLGDRQAPQLIQDDEIVKATPLPALKGSFFKLAGGTGFQRPFELATLRLRNMAESLGHWKTYVPDAAHLTQRGATYLFDTNNTLIYEHVDRNILGFAANMSNPLSFLAQAQDDNARATGK